MKNLIFAVITLLVTIHLFAQEEEYKSKERDDY